MRRFCGLLGQQPFAIAIFMALRAWLPLNSKIKMLYFIVP
jgi:hypothetical protein